MDVSGREDLSTPLRLRYTHMSVDSRAASIGVTIVRVRSRQGVCVPVFIVSYPGAAYTLLYSHGNSIDCGQMLPTWRDMAVNLRVNVVGYEYPGYGACVDSSPTEDLLYDTAAAVVAYLKTAAFCGSLERIIVYGESLGSAPSCAVAASEPVRALILHAPLASGMRRFVEHRPCCLCCCDVFDNVYRAGRLQVTGGVLIMHGTRDSVIPVTHSHMLREAMDASRLPRAADVWYPDADHSDIRELHRSEYYRRLRRFIASLQTDDAAFDTEPVLVPYSSVERAFAQIHGAASARRPVPMPPGVRVGASAASKQ